MRRKLGIVLFPISLLYSIIVGVRNKLFDWKILKSQEFDLPVISVGNITVGGTGKTPHIEYLINLLGKENKLAVLSRGYKRKTKGYILADKNSTAEQIGDEPFQMHRKYKKAHIAVDEKRVHGINQLVKTIPDLNMVLLDDAFQHRYVKPGLSILLIDYSRPISKDKMLPYGDLRERKHEIRRANIIIVTKVPEDVKPIDLRLLIKDLKLFPYQFLYFSSFEYGTLSPVFGEKDKSDQHKDSFSSIDSVLLVTGIANPAQLINHMKQKVDQVKTMSYPDHHNFSQQNIKEIEKNFNKLPGKNKIIATTEKDAARLKDSKHLSSGLKKKFFYLPIVVKILDDKQEAFNKSILDYVKKNKKVDRLYK